MHRVHLLLVAMPLVSSSDAPCSLVTSSDALVPSSDALCSLVTSSDAVC